MLNQVILVDENDNAIGVEDKLVAHQKAKLHRAFSVFVFRHSPPGYELLLQQRHPNKYHTGGLWSNTCCSHPAPNEDISHAAQRRLKQEMGMTVALRKIGQFQYEAPVGNNLTENELDHVFIGICTTEKILIDQEEIADYCWMPVTALLHDLKQTPQKYTPWLKPALQLVLENFPAL